MNMGFFAFYLSVYEVFVYPCPDKTQVTEYTTMQELMQSVDTHEPLIDIIKLTKHSKT